MNEKRPELARTLDRLRNGSGPEYWRGLEELAQTEAFREMQAREFPWRESDGVKGMDRRDFTRLMGASLAMAALSGCVRQPPEHILPYVDQPDGIVQDKPIYFATAMPLPGYATGLLVESLMGRPIKVEGNPRHPASLGGTDAFSQASTLGLYDPDRKGTVLYKNLISTWPVFLEAFTQALQAQAGKRGAGVRILTETVISPTLGNQLQQFLNRYPEARWRQYEPVNRDFIRAGSLLAYGEYVHTIYDFTKASRILSLGSDFLLCGPSPARYAHDFASRRGTRVQPEHVSRMYAVETGYSSTGACADHRLPIRDHEMEAFTRAVARRAGVPGIVAPDLSDPRQRKWAGVIAEDLQRHRGESIVIAGTEQSPVVHALAHALNERLGNVGRTVMHTEPVEFNPVDQMESLRELTADLRAGRVELLIILGGNPVYTAPADIGFADAVTRAKTSVRLGLYADETSRVCTWHVPQTHYLEEWSDALAFEGTAAIVQPLINPLYDGRTAHDVAAAMLGSIGLPSREIVREYWRERVRPADFEKFWREALYAGVVPDTAFPARQVEIRDVAGRLPPPRPSPHGGGYEVIFRPDPTVWDGRFANNAYLQELPKPVPKLTWDNAVFMSPATASRLGVYSYGVVNIELGGRRTRGTIWLQPGHADDSVTLTFGYGRAIGPPTGAGSYNAYRLRTSAEPWSALGLRLEKTGESYMLACTQTHGALTDRYPVRIGAIEEYRKHPNFAHDEPYEKAPPPGHTLYPEFPSEGYQWGMSVDLNACVGCNACVMACNTENNIAIVGKDQVFDYREMHWLRIDRYYHGDPASPRVYFQPLFCVHCEKAPCEPVCPVEATLHTEEGLNAMVYNRCVGTRYCSNNCPYKVRRFNFLLYTDWYTDSLVLMRNPEVTPRARGVMEKCTFCIQRIEHAKIQAKLEDRRIRDGELVTACQQACPTDAIVFGDLNDPTAKVNRLKKSPLDYSLLGELSTRPRLTHMAKLINVNPELGEAPVREQFEEPSAEAKARA